MNETAKFEMYCIVEIFGHTQIAGKVSEQTVAGTGFIRVDVPKTSKRDGFTRFYGPGAIYSMTPVSEEIARIMAEQLEVEAVSEWTLQQAMRDKLLTATVISGNDADTYYGTANYGDDSEDDDESGLGFYPLLDLDDEDIDEDGLERDPSAKQKAVRWARKLLTTDFVIFDTETTGTEPDDEIIQIGIINQAGDVVLEQLIKPTKPITNTVYHGLTDDTVKDAPGFPAVYESIKTAFKGKTVIAYNLDYDSRMLERDCRRHNLGVIGFFESHCAMNQYAQFNGEWNDYHGNYRWVKLREVLAAFGLKHEDFGTKEHDACTDARATLALIQKMAEFEAEKSAAAKA